MIQWYFQEETRSYDWEGLEENMTSAVGKMDSYLVRLICPEKRPNWNELITCDLDTIGKFIDFAESCLQGVHSFSTHKVSNNIKNYNQNSSLFHCNIGKQLLYISECFCR